MCAANKKEWIVKMNLPGACSADLRGHQSVRATFKLSSTCIDAISIVARHLGIKQKSLFDHLAEDMESLTSIAKEVHEIKLSRENRVQKTFVISRRSLCCLEEVSKNHNTPRDALVEYSVQRLLPLIVSERRRQEKRKEMLVEIRKHFQKGALLLAKGRKAFEGEDPFLDRMAAVMANYEIAIEDMEDIVEQGRLIEMFELALSGKRKG